MLNVACVSVGNYQKCGAKYVNCLYAMCRRHITVPFRFVCLTDDAARLHAAIEVIPKPANAWGWWCKIALFAPGAFPAGARVLFFDLDTLIVANIDDLAAYDGTFAGLGCARSNRLFSSGVMAWQAGTADRIWLDWLAAGQPLPGNGDDEWIDRVRPDAVRLQRKFPGIYSYKFHKCQSGPPADARIIYYQRMPKPHNCGAPWVAEHWNED